MNNKSQQMGRPSKRKLMWGISSIPIIVIGIFTTVWMQNSQAQKSDEPATNVKTTDQRSRQLVTTGADGSLIAVDRQTGEVRPLSPDESRRLAEGLKQLIDPTTEGLVEVKHADGSVSMDLKGHFHNVVLAKMDDNGTVSRSCVDNLEAAAGFFDIDPKLLGITKPVSRVKPVKLEER